MENQKREYRILKASDWGRNSPHPKTYLKGEDWYIELQDSEIVSFMLEVGSIVLSEDRIIIYDDYIE